jgi:hypothetical protein
MNFSTKNWRKVNFEIILIGEELMPQKKIKPNPKECASDHSESDD